MAQRSTQRTDILSAARCSDILPESYLRSLSNLPVHRSVCARKGFHHADLIIISDIQRNVKTFFSVFHSFFEIFLAVRGCTRQRGKCPPPGYFPLRYSIPDQAASAYYNGVSIRYKEHRDAIHPGVPYYICPQIPSLAFSAAKDTGRLGNRTPRPMSSAVVSTTTAMAFTG